MAAPAIAPQRARYVELGRLLPELLTDAQLASKELGGDDQAHALTITAHAYNTTSSALRRLGDNELALIAADRAVQTARSVNDSLLLAASAYRLANVFLPVRRLVEAKEVALSAAAGLDGRPDASGAHLAIPPSAAALLTSAVTACVCCSTRTPIRCRRRTSGRPAETCSHGKR